MIINDEFLELYVLMCNTISKPVRLKIIYLIGKGKMNVSTMQAKLKIPMSNISNHLGALYRAGVVSKEKNGNFVFYSLTDPLLPEAIRKMQKILKSINLKRNSLNV
jgi:ArsR family transcriptional regulator